MGRIALNAARALALTCALGGLSGMAAAQTAPAPAPAARPAAKPAPAKPARAPAAITVTNGRAVIMTGLEIADGAGQVVGTLTRPLAAGKAARVALKGQKGCVYTVAAVFEDDSETEALQLDLCKDAKVRLVD